MKKFKCKSPKAEPTSKQTWAVKCMTGQDIRETGLTRQEVSDMIGDLKSKGKAVLPAPRTMPNKDIVLYTRERAKGGGEKSNSKATRKRSKKSWAEELCSKAEAAGQKAMDELIASKTVQPMVVAEHANMLDDSSPVKKSWVVKGGACGFASIRVKCMNGPSRKFINQLKKAGIAGDRNTFKQWSKSDYYGGYMKSFTLIGGQSLAYKVAYAYAYSEVLSNEGIDTWVWTKDD